MTTKRNLVNPEHEFEMPAPEYDRLKIVNAELLSALESAELSCTQARLANGIGEKTKAEQIQFLLASFELLAKEARAAIAKAKGE